MDELTARRILRQARAHEWQGAGERRVRSRLTGKSYAAIFWPKGELVAVAAEPEELQRIKARLPAGVKLYGCPELLSMV